ncbi:MAG: PIN domain-containing protein [Caballeronia sp.]
MAQPAQAGCAILVVPSYQNGHSPAKLTPADRMIVATARKLAAPLVTNDPKIRAYAHVKTIW